MDTYIVVRQVFTGGVRVSESVEGIYESELDAIRKVLEVSEELHRSMVMYYSRGDSETDDITPQAPVVRRGADPLKLVVRDTSSSYVTISYSRVEIDGNLLFDNDDWGL